MERGTCTEKGVQPILEGIATEDEGIELALKNFDKKCNPDMKNYHTERATIPYLIKGAVKEIQNNLGSCTLIKQRLKVYCMSINFMDIRILFWRIHPQGKKQLWI